MLTECYPKLLNNRFVGWVRGFLLSPCYLALIAAMMVCANLFSLELIVFYGYLAIGLAVVLFADDLRGIVPIACCCYMAISYENNPAIHVQTSAFYDPAFVVQLAFISAAAGILLAGRLLSLVLVGGRRRLPALAIGFFALGLSFLLAGLFTEYYDFRTVLFGFVTILALGGLYFFFYYGVLWHKVGKSYFAQVFLAIGLALVVELGGMYVKSGILTDPSLDRNVLITGWGMYNNVGCVLCMCLPAALYLSLKGKHGWIFTILGVLLGAAIVLTQSRGSMLFGAPLYLAGLIFLLVKCGKKERRGHLIVLGACLLLLVVLAVVFREKLYALFKNAIDQTFGDDPSHDRGPIYREGFEHFRSAPFFGVGFYRCTAFRWGDLSDKAFLPPRYHNTFVQLLASGGIFAFACYLLHRLETAFLLFARPSAEKVYIALCILGLLLTSQVECHFFSFGPGLLYSVLLVCAEGLPEKGRKQSERRKSGIDSEKSSQEVKELL